MPTWLEAGCECVHTEESGLPNHRTLDRRKGGCEWVQIEESVYHVTETFAILIVFISFDKTLIACLLGGDQTVVARQFSCRFVEFCLGG